MAQTNAALDRIHGRLHEVIALKAGILADIDDGLIGGSRLVSLATTSLEQAELWLFQVMKNERYEEPE